MVELKEKKQKLAMGKFLLQPEKSKKKVRLKRRTGPSGEEYLRKICVEMRNGTDIFSNRMHLLGCGISNENFCMFFVRSSLFHVLSGDKVHWGDR